VDDSENISPLMDWIYVDNASGKLRFKWGSKNIHKMAQDIISDCLNQIMNARRAGKTQLEVRRISKFLIEILKIAKEKGYLNFKMKEKSIEIEILDLIECKTIKPRFNVQNAELEKYMRRFLPARGFGVLIVSTSKGLMTQDMAIEKNVGGNLIAYFY